jgi:hypothetical protein
VSVGCWKRHFQGYEYKKDFLITEMGVSDEAKNVIPLKFLRKIKNKFFFPLVNSIRGHTVYLFEGPIFYVSMIITINVAFSLDRIIDS